MSRKRSKSQVDLTTAKIGFIGAGKMTEALICGLVNFGKIPAKHFYVAAPSQHNSEALKTKYPGLNISKRNLDIFGKFDCDIIILAINGNVIRNLYKLGGMRPAPLTTNYIPNMKHPIYVLSLITGYEISQLRECLLNPDHPDKYQLEMHRVVFSYACAWGNGVCAIDVEPDSKNLADIIRTMLSMVGKLEYIPESQMDAACALCGAGLAFCFYFINAIADGSVKIGLNRSIAIKIAAKAVNCATQTMLETGKLPTQLKDEVCAPSGGAIYGISVLDKTDVGSAIASAVEEAYKRAMGLAREG